MILGYTDLNLQVAFLGFVMVTLIWDLSAFKEV